MRALNVRNMRNTRQSGFTIIELVVVILLLGILTATALPRFLDVTDQAHDSVVEAVYGGMNTGIALFHSGWRAEGEPAANTVSSTFGALNLRNNAAGYPMSTTSDVTGVVNAGADCVEIYSGVLQAGSPTIDPTPVTATVGGFAIGDVTGSIGDIQALHSAAVTTTCYYVYTAQYIDDAAAVAAADELPVIVYDSTTGVVVLSDGSNF
jgi:MSHA pilin protein MshB